MQFNTIHSATKTNCINHLIQQISLLFLITMVIPAHSQIYKCGTGKGDISYSNSPCDGKDSLLISKASNNGANALRNTKETIEMIKSALAEPDIQKRRALASTVDETVLAQKARMNAYFYEQADLKSGVAHLENDLHLSEQADKADPRWSIYRSDSPVTARIRAQLLAARNQTDTIATQLMRENPEYSVMIRLYESFERSISSK